MDWKINVDKFFEKGKSTLSFCEFFHNTLGFHQKDKAGQWRALSEHLKKWNEKYLLQYETIVLYSPETWGTLDIDVNCFCILENETHIEDWLYWAYLSACMNSGISSTLILRMEENRLNAVDFFVKTQEDLGFEAEQFLMRCEAEYFFESNYIWIDAKTFLQKLAQNRERSYQKLAKELSDCKEEQKKYLQENWLPMYEKYKKYEAIFQNGSQNKTTLEIAEINPQEKEMWYLVKMENQVYLFSIEDYALY